MGGCSDHAAASRGAGTPTHCKPVPPGPCSHTPISQLLGDDQVPQVVLSSTLVVLQQRVGVAQAVAGLRFHCLVPELPRQLQRLPVQNERVVPKWVAVLPFPPQEHNSSGGHSISFTAPDARGCTGSHWLRNRWATNHAELMTLYRGSKTECPQLRTMRRAWRPRNGPNPEVSVPSSGHHST